ncbi:AI-2E family transporter [Sphaerospermopsis sp. LEGE 08334]|uniref:AI-2E family transporter n=1 Tax=Sphaerospermopsis sp. LEGE 08334 TaxID=1828651 RepID=UPI00187FC4E6|nr:AI-2E family transporter [Sphaerospermopsis sp. LEGE 08334]MBE9057671.1 AI-2E family transporter [Sphaerospermopsis sp. LEGE 08334]
MRFGQWLGLLALIISLYIIWQIRQIILIAFAAVALATVLNQIVRFLQKMRMRRSLAVSISIGLLLLIIIIFALLIVPSIIDQLQQFSNLIPMALERINSWNNWLIRVIPDNILENIRGLQYLTQGVQTWVNQIIRNFFILLNSSFTIVLGLLLFLVLTVMFLANPGTYRRGFIMLFPAFYRPRVDHILTKCANSLVGWIRGTLLAMLAIAMMSYIGLLILGIPLPLINALLAGLLEFIPNVGPTLSVIPPALLALNEAPWKAVAVIILYFGIQQVESLILVPLLMKSQVSLLPAVTILAVVIFGSFFGFLGVFLAVPLVIILQTWIKEVLVKDILDHWHSN